MLSRHIYLSSWYDEIYRVNITSDISASVLVIKDIVFYYNVDIFLVMRMIKILNHEPGLQNQKRLLLLVNISLVFLHFISK